MTECPQCRSDDVGYTPGGIRVCGECGHQWPPDDDPDKTTHVEPIPGFDHDTDIYDALNPAHDLHIQIRNRLLRRAFLHGVVAGIGLAVLAWIILTGVLLP